ncbi:hypothetical protein BDZ89DRAFT_1046721 [Hymenopellis radicata]|nr:hypothetical protein BDZ89DRAFT_1046721 [Hymenopellis radicata]
MSRQWAFLGRLRRAGVGHLAGGWTTAKEGSVAVSCWACPREHINIPEGWRDNPAMRFLYRLIVSMDANFRLKERLRLNSRGDDPLYSGLGYQPDLSKYADHLKHYVKESDVSSCVAFAAMMQRESRLTSGLRVSGVGGCVCARHESIRPQGLGDLQKGERWSNMDYIFWGATRGIGCLDVLLTYDIACQYNKHVNERRTHLPSSMRAGSDEGEHTYALPIWHGDVHAVECKTRWSLLYIPGAGKTDGEGPERVWALLNGMASDTKEMDVGTRHDRIEDRCDKHNFLKNVGLGRLLARRLIIARKESNLQRNAFEEVCATLRGELREDWTNLVDEWGLDRSKPSPFAPSGAATTGITERSTFNDNRGWKPVKPVLGKQDKLRERRVGLVRQFRQFRRQQRLLMPPAEDLWVAEDDKDRARNTVTLAENVKLWLPSAIPETNDIYATRNCSNWRLGFVEANAWMRSPQFDSSS